MLTKKFNKFVRRLFVALFLWITSVSYALASDLITIDGPCIVSFSPNGGVTSFIVKSIDMFQGPIHVLAYNFTSQEIGDALIRAKKRGQEVELVLDRSVPTERNSLLPQMLAAGIPTWIDRTHKIAHNKVIIFVDEGFETGSFNYTSNAEHNNGENSIICPSKSGAVAYEKDFQAHKAHSVKAE